MLSKKKKKSKRSTISCVLWTDGHIYIKSYGDNVANACFLFGIFRGVILGAKVTEYLLEKSRIVTQAPEERNYHVFYELLAGLAEEEKLKYGLLSAEKYFYLNQGGNCEIDGKYDGEDFQSLMSAMQVLGFTSEEQDTIFRILASGKS